MPCTFSIVYAHRRRFALVHFLCMSHFPFSHWGKFCCASFKSCSRLHNDFTTFFLSLFSSGFCLKIVVRCDIVIRCSGKAVSICHFRFCVCLIQFDRKKGFLCEPRGFAVCLKRESISIKWPENFFLFFPSLQKSKISMGKNGMSINIFTKRTFDWWHWMWENAYVSVSSPLLIAKHRTNFYKSSKFLD